MNLNSKVAASLRWEQLRCPMGERGWREVPYPGASRGAMVPQPTVGHSYCPSQCHDQTGSSSPHSYVTLSSGFCSLAAGFLSGPDLLQMQDPGLGSPRKRVGGRCPLSLTPWKCCSLRPQGHREGSSKDLLLRLIMIYNCAPSLPFLHLTELL